MDNLIFTHLSELNSSIKSLEKRYFSQGYDYFHTGNIFSIYMELVSCFAEHFIERMNCQLMFDVSCHALCVVLYSHVYKRVIYSYSYCFVAETSFSNFNISI